MTIKHIASIRHDLIELATRLDKIGFDVGAYRISVYRGVLMLVVIVAVIVLGRLAGMVTRRSLRRMSRLDATQQVLGEKLIGIVVWMVLILAGIDFLGISLTALTVFTGTLGLAVGFGLQKTFGNLISGIILLMDGSIKPGDVIAVGDPKGRTVGQVNRIGMRAVSVITRDKVEYLIPNEVLMTTQVENWSFSSRDVRVKIPVTVAYGSDVDLVERLLIEEARKQERVLRHNEPAVWMTALGDNGIEFEVQLWIDDPEEGLGSLRSDYLKAVWRKFGEHGIEVPYPQRDLRIKEWPGKPAAVSGDSST